MNLSDRTKGADPLPLDLTTKRCQSCGEFFSKPNVESWTRWRKRKVCSVKCVHRLRSFGPRYESDDRLVPLETLTRIPHNQRYVAMPTNDKVPDAPCKTCGQLVTIGTDGDGRLAGYDRITNERHPCREV